MTDSQPPTNADYTIPACNE